MLKHSATLTLLALSHLMLPSASPMIAPKPHTIGSLPDMAGKVIRVLGRASKNHAAPPNTLLHSYVYTRAMPLSTNTVRPVLSHCLVHCMALLWLLSHSFLNFLFAILCCPSYGFTKMMHLHVTVRSVCDSRPQLVCFLATNIQPCMQPMHRCFPCLLCIMEMVKTN